MPVLLAYNLPIGLDDMFQYDMLARSLVAGNGYRWYGQEDLSLIQQHFTMEVPPEYDPRGVLTSFRPPAYPAFLALVYGIFGVEPHTLQFPFGDIILSRFFFARLAQAFLGAALAPLTWALARRVGFSERAARWAAVFIAAFPLLIAYTLGLATENLFLPLLALALVLLLRASEGGGARDYALAGLILGFTALTRSMITAFVPLVAMWLWWTAEKKRAGLRNIVILSLCFLLATVPWAMRNTLLHRRLTWIESSLGYDLYVGYHPQSTGTFKYPISLDLIPILDDGERDARGMAAFWNFVHADPGRVPYLMLRKAGHLWGLDRRALMFFYGNGFLGQWPTWLVWLVFLLDCGPLVVLAPLAALGLTCGRMDRRKVLLLLLLVYYTIIHMLILAEPRFHLPLLPVALVLAAYALIERPWRTSRPWQQALALLLISLLFLNWGLELARDWDILVKFLGPEGYKLGLPY